LTCNAHGLTERAHRNYGTRDDGAPAKAGLRRTGWLMSACDPALSAVAVPSGFPCSISHSLPPGTRQRALHHQRRSMGPRRGRHFRRCVGVFFKCTIVEPVGSRLLTSTSLPVRYVWLLTRTRTGDGLEQAVGKVVIDTLPEDLFASSFAPLAHRTLAFLQANLQSFLPAFSREYLARCFHG
jgi:hypothetical protein